MENKYDFGGWATRYNTPCSDGRTILPTAFKHLDGVKVPLVWNHKFDGPDHVIGHAILKHTDAGVYSYCSFNDNETAQTAKNLVKHGDITALSIFANKLKQDGGRVLHGEIREVSLVLAGANPGACIQEVMMHNDTDETSATIFNDETELDLEISHSDQNEEATEELEHADKEKTVEEVYNAMSDEQKAVVAIIAEKMLEDDYENNNQEDDEEDNNMKHNVFEQNKDNLGGDLKHSEFVAESIKNAKKYGSLKESFLAHAETYGITNIGELFPAETLVGNEPTIYDRDQTWVDIVFNGTKKSPFSRLKAMFADTTADAARAKGYETAKLKKEEVFSLFKRTTSPTTIYKKQKLDRDDILDITDFDVVAFMKREMRMKLNEEIARAILIGDGRDALSEDKIKEANIRPIYNDSDLYTIKAVLGTVGSLGKAHEFIKTVIKAMAEYEGEGTPTLFVEPSMLSDMLLIEDSTGRFIYENESVLAKNLRVKEIVPVPVMKGLKRNAGDGKTHNVLGVVVNVADYTVGADKGGQVSMFEDFDIDYNQQKYLIETRCSGALLKPKTAITIEEVVSI
ncbi:hypothetical protein SDC9_59464 [bioreactor metagenome]|uniref:Uncharacterized protein n=1 Tax=bioreactor metagenome TaxID=1076179 RepID=A0A644XAH1_9ZZZZ